MKPMLDLKKQYAGIKDEILAMTSEIFESAHYVLGKKGAELEENFKAFHGMKEAIGVASGTDALHLAVRALGLGPGDEVITTPFTFFATVEAIMYVGATPVLCDVDPDTYNIDPVAAEKLITKKTKAILPVHIFGNPADMEKITALAAAHNLKIIEDCAQSIGASLNGKMTGSFGDAGCFSFYPTKNLGAYGDGGMIILRDGEVADEVRKLRNHGSKGAYRHDCLGYNSRLDEIQAGVLLVKWKRLDEYNSKRRENAALYTQLMSDIVKCPTERQGARHVYHQYTIQSPKRDAIQAFLKEKGISSVIYYPIALHMQDALKKIGYKEGDFPVVEKVSREVLSLPMYPELEKDDIRATAEAVRQCLNG
jgi:UDP-2-acetamido-2-deoxy-ribo-hexuluronate aminotransferase